MVQRTALPCSAAGTLKHGAKPVLMVSKMAAAPGAGCRLQLAMAPGDSPVLSTSMLDRLLLWLAGASWSGDRQDVKIHYVPCYAVLSCAVPCRFVTSWCTLRPSAPSSRRAAQSCRTPRCCPCPNPVAAAHAAAGAAAKNELCSCTTQCFRAGS